MAAGAAAVARRKLLHLTRHGQAQHNVRAEALRKGGGSYQAFLDQMAADDAFDAPLTELGRQQAADAGILACENESLKGVQLVVASPLSRALDTADAILPPGGSHGGAGGARRLVLEELREISGLLLNAKRRPRSELEELYPAWDFSSIAQADELWTAELEAEEACAERGYQALQHIWATEEDEVLLVAHGGLFSFLFNGKCPRVRADGRLGARFENCEVRSATLRAEGDSEAVTFVLE